MTLTPCLEVKPQYQVTFTATDSPTASPIYYNLQGQRIQQPAHGQVVIRHQGTSATKMIYPIR